MERHGNRARPGVQHFGWEKARAVCHPPAAVSVVPTQAASLRAGIRHSGLVGPTEHHLNIPGSAPQRSARANGAPGFILRTEVKELLSASCTK